MDFTKQQFGEIGEMASNIPSSAWEFLKSQSQAFMDPAGTGRQLGKLVRENPKAIPQFFIDRYGGMDRLKHTMMTDPAGVAADLSMLLTGGGTIAERIPGVVGDVAKTVGTAGRAVDPALQASRLAGWGAGKAGTVGGTSLAMRAGVGREAIETAGRAGLEGGEAGKAFREGLRSKDPLVDAEKTVEESRKGVQSIQDEASQAHERNLKRIFADKTPLNFASIDRSIAKNAGVQPSFKGVTIDPRTHSVRQEINAIADTWRDGGKTDPSWHSAEGLDAMRRRIGNIFDRVDQGTPERKIVSNTYYTIRNEISRQHPGYAKVMDAYDKTKSTIKELRRALSLGDKATIDTAIRKLQSVMRNNVNTGWGYRRGLAELLAQYTPNLMEKLSGQSLSSLEPRGIRRGLGGLEIPTAMVLAFSHPHLSLAIAADLMAQSPRLVGETVHAAGRAARLAGAPFRLLNKYTGVTPRGIAAGGYQAGRMARNEQDIEKRTSTLRDLINPKVFDELMDNVEGSDAVQRWQRSPSKSSSRFLASKIAKLTNTPKLVPQIEDEINRIKIDDQ
jgi:hypothetical protein